MADHTWPTALDNATLVQGVSFEPLVENVISTQMAAGAPKRRRRFTSVPELVKFVLEVDASTMQVLHDFVTITLKDVLPFNWVDFRRPSGDQGDGTTNTAVYRFVGRPKYVPDVPGQTWLAHITLELVSGPLARSLNNQDLDPVTGERVPPVLDLFVIVGQSNAEGRGDSAQSPAAPNGRYISGSTITSPLADPVGGALTGSMWPAFSNEWYAQTERRSAFVEQAKGSTWLTPGGPSGDWSPSGTLRAPAAAAANTAIAAINASADYTLGSVYFIWAQGEGDAEASISEATYEQALEDLATYFKAQVPEMVSMAVIRTASNGNDRSWDAEYLAIRKAQEDACTDSLLLTMAYRGTYSFRALGYMADSVHYNQDGLNLAGKCAARGLLSPEAIPGAPSLLASENFTDTDYATTATSRTVAHTTAPGTDLVVVVVSWMRPGSSTTFSIDSVTFGGVNMTQAVEQAAGTSSPQCRTNSAIYYIDAEAYGASLDDITANIVVAEATAANLIEICVLNIANADFVDDRLGALTTASGASINMSYTTGAPAITVAICSSAAASASALTSALSSSLSGSMTELMDVGASNGTRSGQCVVGYRVDSVPYADATISATFSASCDRIGLAVASFRKKWNGE